ncbi:hypothetical protein [uncultured Clostridium sp.]|uniref:hypothetical protein n=1 Tax=uncultured Clostridium sp. TaxID=59620 RepID=UPI00258873AA|nr:hypothetical protein [uncultured Clostridium sp.]
MRRKVAIIGIIFVIVGGMYEMPKEHISLPYQYVGGDAYNYIIESSLRGGKIAGAIISKAIYVIGGSIMILISSLNLSK